jgi:lipopolysaccharide biosynthesis glycosyltransferase
MKNLIYIVSIDHNTSRNKCSNYSQYCIKSWESWCKKHDVELIVNTVHDDRFGRPIWNKELIYDIGKDYNKIGVVDSDTMIKWDAPNIFDMFDDEFCGVNDIVNIGWVMNSINLYKKFFPGIEIDLMTYMNAGVLFFHNKYLDVFKQVLDLYLDNQEELDNWDKGGGREQTILNHILVKNNVKKKFLNYSWNLLHIHRKNMFTHNWQLNTSKMPHFIKHANIWHFTGFPVEEREKIMKQVWDNYKENY